MPKCLRTPEYCHDKLFKKLLVIQLLFLTPEVKGMCVVYRNDFD